MSAFDALYSVDLGTRQATSIGPTGFYAGQRIAIEGMAYAPDHTLYGVSDSLKGLFRISGQSGTASVVGSLSVPGQSVSTNLDTSLAVTADGRFYMASATSGELYKIDPKNGKSTLVGRIGAKITGLAARGNELYGAGSRGDEGLYRIDTASGKATLLNRFNNVITYAATISVAFDADERLWAVINYNPPQSDNGPIATWSDLAEIDVNTGGIALRGSITGPEDLQQIPIRGLSITAPRGGPPPAAAPIPAMSPFALALLAALVAGTAWRRRRPSAR